MADKSPTQQPLLEDYQRALKSMQTFIDITADDLMTLAQRAVYYAGIRENESIIISEIMTQPVHVIPPDTRMSEAAHILITRRISGLPIVNEEQKLIGILSEADFLRDLVGEGFCSGAIEGDVDHILHDQTPWFGFRWARS